MKRKNNNKINKSHFHSYSESDWITNFWVIGDSLYVTDSTFEDKKNMLAKIKLDTLFENLKIKKTLDRSFIAHPHPLKSESALKSSLSDFEVIDYYEYFIYNVFSFENKIYVSLIKNNESKVIVFDELNENPQEVKEYKNMLVIGQINGSLVTKSVLTRETFVNGEETKIHHIKKIVYTDEYYIIQTDLNHIHKLNKSTLEDEIIKDNSDGINISNFDYKTYVVSDKEQRLTYIINNSGRVESIADNYFYRLDCFGKELLIGKPLFTDWGTESYTLPITFID